MIKNVVFDMGGVLIDLYPERTIEAFCRLADQADQMQVQDLLGNGGQSLLHEYEIGAISTETFMQETLKACRPGTTMEEVKAASFAILGDIPAARLEAIRSLRKRGYRTYLLSNIQDMHWDFISERWLGGIDVDGNGYNNHDLFDDVFLSQRIGVTKPDARIYTEMITKSGIVPDETLYIDDLEMNVQGGLQAGLRAVQAKGDEWLPLVAAL